MSNIHEPASVIYESERDIYQLTPFNFFSWKNSSGKTYMQSNQLDQIVGQCLTFYQRYILLAYIQYM